ncbi:MAG: hypothetical protein WEC75_05450 [Dehalococcoidia bacterium]
MLKGDRYEFTKENVGKVPTEHGVYQLEDGATIIYVGRASGTGVTLRSRLQSHQAGNEGSCTKGASHYRREVTEGAIPREKELLEEHKKAHGKYPRCNEQAP